MGYLARRVPSAAAGQFRLFKQHNIVPAFMCEMVRKATAHDTAAHNDDLRVGREILFSHAAPHV